MPSHRTRSPRAAIPARHGGARNLPVVDETSAGGLIVEVQGHLEGSETPEQAAVREIAEETGITGRVLKHLATIDYWFAGSDHRVHKVVHHFLLEATGGDLTTENDPDHEAEDVAWVDLEDVSRRLAYPNERRIVAAAREILVGDG